MKSGEEIISYCKMEIVRLNELLAIYFEKEQNLRDKILVATNYDEKKELVKLRVRASEDLIKIRCRIKSLRMVINFGEHKP